MTYFTNTKRALEEFYRHAAAGLGQYVESHRATKA